MVTQLIKKVILIGSFALFSVFVYGQKSPFAIASDVGKECFYPGDTLSFTIKNLTSNNRGYTVEATCVDAHLKQNTAYNEFYTAYFNRDTSFFRKIKERDKSHKEGVRYMPPDYQLIPYDIDSDSLSTFVFIIRGDIMKSGIAIKLVIYPDLVDGNPDIPIETKPFYIFAKAM